MTATRCTDVTTWRRAVLASDLTPAAKVVGMALHEHMTWDAKRTDAGSTYVSLDTVARSAGTCRRTVTRGLTALTDAGFISRDRGGLVTDANGRERAAGGQGKTVTYNAMLPPQVGRHAPDEQGRHAPVSEPRTGATSHGTGATSPLNRGDTPHDLVVPREDLATAAAASWEELTIQHVLEPPFVEAGKGKILDRRSIHQALAKLTGWTLADVAAYLLPHLEDVDGIKRPDAYLATLVGKLPEQPDRTYAARSSHAHAVALELAGRLVARDVDRHDAVARLTAVGFTETTATQVFAGASGSPTGDAPTLGTFWEIPVEFPDPEETAEARRYARQSLRGVGA